MPARRVYEIVKGLRGVSVDTALRLGTFSGIDAQRWIYLQNYNSTENARELMASVLRRFKQHSATDIV